MTPELVLIRGLPGSGKSTMAQTLALVGYRHFEADMFYELKGVPFTPITLQQAHRWCADQTEAALQSGANVVVSNTFTRVRELSDYVLTADALGATLRIIEATGNFGSTKPISESKLSDMRDRWEPLPCPPDELVRLFMLKPVR